MTAANPVPFVEKYRPKNLDEIVDQDDSVSSLKRSMKSMNLPHLLFYGPPGTGKSSTILAMAKEIYGDLYKTRVLELNASDERGINIVRTKIKEFAKISVNSQNPPYKLIILDEADSMTSDAQSALRRTMETYSKITRFCLICNYVTRIIDPLASRCAKFRFKKLDTNLMISRLEHISAQEGINVSKNVLETLVSVSEGDLRQAITLLQTVKQVSNGQVVSNDILEMTGNIPPEELEGLFKAWVKHDPIGIQKEIRGLFKNGYSGLQLLQKIQEEVVGGVLLPKEEKGPIAVKLGKVEKCIFDGADEELQILNLLLCK